MARIIFEIEGQRQLDRRLKGFAKDVKDFRPELKKSGIFLKEFFSGRVFDTKGGAIGEPWKPLKPATVREKRRKGYPQPSYPLIRSGKMREGFRKHAKKMMVTVWNTQTYFKYHQSRRPRRHLPRRVMMKLTGKIVDEIVGIIHDGIHKRLNKKQ